MKLKPVGKEEENGGYLYNLIHQRTDEEMNT